MLARLTILLLVALRDAVEGASLQINDWYELPIAVGQSATLDFCLYASCERFSLVFASDTDELNRLTFWFDGEDLQKVDVDSPHYVLVPSPPPVIGGCRESDVKSLRLNVSFRENAFDVQIGRQVVIRPKGNSSTSMRLLLPQRGACCLSTGKLSIGNETLVEPVKENSLVPTTSVSPYSTRYRSLFIGRRVPPAPEPTAKLEIQRPSWTDVVNREWSISFLICSISVLVMMVTMVSLGIVIFIYVQIKPSTSRRSILIEG
ncbi:hypothetical protein GCK32_014741 [Trichostrongylus colubriformis]|uniref:Uncharacterized protein n=1 Tax=Trichostrongylus colubriformis TaxID=6319 RepID=A0AAN8EWI4_TRICO